MLENTNGEEHLCLLCQQGEEEVMNQVQVITFF